MLRLPTSKLTLHQSDVQPLKFNWRQYKCNLCLLHKFLMETPTPKPEAHYENMLHIARCTHPSPLQRFNSQGKLNIDTRLHYKVLQTDRTHHANITRLEQSSSEKPPYGHCAQVQPRELSDVKCNEWLRDLHRVSQQSSPHGFQVWRRQSWSAGKFKT